MSTESKTTDQLAESDAADKRENDKRENDKRESNADSVSASSSLVSLLRAQIGETPRQAGMLFSAQMLSTITGLLASIVLGRAMEPSELGKFAFCQGFVVIASLFFDLGIFPAGARVLALARNKASEQRALGALVLMAVVIGAVFSLFIAGASIPVDLIFKQNVRWVFTATAVLAFFLPFQLLIEQSCQGLNQIRRLSLFQLSMTGANLLILVGLALAHSLSAGSALAAYLTGIGLASMWTLARLRPSFRDTSHYVRLTLKEVRGYGLNLYFARITGTAMTRFDAIVITYFLGRASAGLAPLGLYAIAQKLGNPITTMSRSLAITRFRAFTRLARVPRRITRWNATVLVAASVALVVLGPFAINIVFPKYAGAIPLLVPFALYNLFSGLFQPYNMFLSSHGRGAELRNIALIITIAGLSGMLLAVPRFGVAGAAWTGAASMLLDYLLHFYYYQRFRRTLDSNRE